MRSQQRARSRDTYLAAKYRRIASRRGPIKAIVAIEHEMLTAIWNMITNGVFSEDLGGDYDTKLNPDETKQRVIAGSGQRVPPGGVRWRVAQKMSPRRPLASPPIHTGVPRSPSSHSPCILTWLSR